MPVTKGAKTPADVAALAERVEALEKSNAVLAGRVKRLDARVKKLETPDEGPAE